MLKVLTVSTEAFELFYNLFGSFVDFFREASDEVGLNMHSESPGGGALIVQQLCRNSP